MSPDFSGFLLTFIYPIAADFDAFQGIIMHIKLGESKWINEKGSAFFTAHLGRFSE